MRGVNKRTGAKRLYVDSLQMLAACRRLPRPTVTFTDDGQEPHVMVFARINDGYTVDEAVAAEGKKGTAEEVGVVQAKPGESSTLEVTKTLEAGHYALLCPLTTKDGQPHYKLGQLQEFDISD